MWTLSASSVDILKSRFTSVSFPPKASQTTLQLLQSAAFAPSGCSFDAADQGKNQEHGRPQIQLYYTRLTALRISASASIEMTRVKKDKRCLNARMVEFGQITNRKTFIQGLQNAGFLIGDRDVGAYRYPAKRARLTLKNCRLEGKTISARKLEDEPRIKESPFSIKRMHKTKAILRVVGDAFHEEAFKAELARGGYQSALAMQSQCKNIEPPNPMTTPRKVNLVVAEVDGEEEQALKTSPPESNKSPAPRLLCRNQGSRRGKGRSVVLGRILCFMMLVRNGRYARCLPCMQLVRSMCQCK